jgi:tetratricopeptide (TPR) repeat protein
MATEVKHPTDKSSETKTEQPVGARGQDFWTRNSKFFLYGIVALIVVIGGYFVYQNYFKAPQEAKAAEAMWKAEDYFRMDSARLALNGDGTNAGFLRIISRHGGTKAANLAKFYAGASYLKLGDFNNAVKYLKDFSTEDKLVQVRATGLLADAYAEQGKRKEAAEQYEKAGTMYPDDMLNSPEYLFRAGLLYQDLGNTKEAIEMFQLIKSKYSMSQRGRDIEKYLARLGQFE